MVYKECTKFLPNITPKSERQKHTEILIGQVALNHRPSTDQTSWPTLNLSSLIVFFEEKSIQITRLVFTKAQPADQSINLFKKFNHYYKDNCGQMRGNSPWYSKIKTELQL